MPDKLGGFIQVAIVLVILLGGPLSAWMKKRREEAARQTQTRQRPRVEDTQSAPASTGTATVKTEPRAPRPPVAERRPAHVDMRTTGRQPSAETEAAAPEAVEEGEERPEIFGVLDEVYRRLETAGVPQPLPLPGERPRPPDPARRRQLRQRPTPQPPPVPVAAARDEFDVAQQRRRQRDLAEAEQRRQEAQVLIQQLEHLMAHRRRLFAFHSDPVVSGIIFSEILHKPLALRPRTGISARR